MKTKVLPMLALFVSLALTSCGSSTDKSGAASSSGKPNSSGSAAHVHTFDTSKWESDATYHWHPATCEHTTQKGDRANHTLEAFNDATHVDKAATCKEEGVKYEKCSVCGYIKETKINKLDHTWNDGVASGNCGEAGKVTYTCTACGETKEEVTGYIQHSWEVTGKVDAGDGGLEYNLVKCTKCQKEGLMVAVKNADGTNNMTVTGTPKTAPEGCVKLGATNDSMTAVIKLAAAKTGKLYFRGSMDYWYTSNNQNEQKGIYDGKGTASKDNGVANFKREVGPDADHLEEVALTADKNLLYKDFLPEEVGFTGVADTDWSQIGDIEVGNVSLQAGLNTIRFTRIDSYNLAVHDFVVAFDAVA